jgi:GDPmannose 4,6-dehydratase
MKTALITGASGQDAYYLSDLLLSKGYKVVATQRRVGRPQSDTVDMLLKNPDFSIIEADVTDISSIMRAVMIAKPDEFYHLGSQPEVGTSFGQPITTFDITGAGTLNCLEALRICKPDTRFYFAGSSEQFGGLVNGYKFLNEKSPMLPRSPYAVAKLAGYHMTRVYREAYGMFCCSGILQNHESPHRKPYFVTRKIVMGFVDIVLGRKNHIELGNLESKRAWYHAADAVQAMWLMLQLDKPDDFVIGNDQCYSVREFCEAVGKALGMENPLQYVKVNQEFVRPNEVHVLVADPSKARTVLGWKQKYSFEDLVNDMVNEEMIRNGINKCACS